MATVAVFIALGGVAWALADNSVRSRHIVNGTIRAADVNHDVFPLLQTLPGRAASQVRVYHTELNTNGVTNDLDFGRVKLDVTASTKFRVCAEGLQSGQIAPVVVYQNTTRSATTLAIGGACTTPDFTTAHGDDFRISLLDTLILLEPNGTGGNAVPPRFDVFAFAAP
jgi:hypothetical protein